MAPAPKGGLKVQVGLRTLKAGGQVLTDLCRAYLLHTGIDLVKCQGAHTQYPDGDLKMKAGEGRVVSMSVTPKSKEVLRGPGCRWADR